MNNGDARAEIMRSIRSHLAASVRYDGREKGINNDLRVGKVPCKSPFPTVSRSVVEEFKRNLEAVDGRCFMARDDAEVAAVLSQLTQGKRVATSDAPPLTKDLFNFDVGVTKVQAAIAETGTLVLDSAAEKNRLVSLVPPVHIAILEASRIYATLGETLAALQSNGEVSPAITFITGPSRTADIELTLAIGVHGPQELYVIIVEDQNTPNANNR